MNMFSTGYVRLMMVGFELSAGFSSFDCCGCLDAPNDILGGSTKRYESWEGLVGRAYAMSSRANRGAE